MYQYIIGIIQNHGHKVLAINGIPDHLHIFFGMRPTQSLSNLMQDVKGDSSKWINKRGFVKGRFSWQEGFGGFSYSKSHVYNVIDFIKNQEIHHHKKSFIEEYLEFLEKFEVPFDERYIFKPVEYEKEDRFLLSAVRQKKWVEIILPIQNPVPHGTELQSSSNCCYPYLIPNGILETKKYH